MGIAYRLKHHFFSAFREIFVHHHGSLEFRAKIFALVISASDEIHDDGFEIIRDIGMHIYDGNSDRSELLLTSTKELVHKVRDDNGLDIDSLVNSIQNELKVVPRYAKKIDIHALTPLLSLSRDPDNIAYQKNIIEFLEKLKYDTQNKK